MIEGTLIVFGVMISYWIDLGFSFLEPSTITWRFPIAFQILSAPCSHPIEIAVYLRHHHNHEVPNPAGWSA